MFCEMHEIAKREHEKNPDVLYFKKAHAKWQHYLLEMEKLEIMNKNINKND